MRARRFDRFLALAALEVTAFVAFAFLRERGASGVVDVDVPAPSASRAIVAPPAIKKPSAPQSPNTGAPILASDATSDSARLSAVRDPNRNDFASLQGSVIYVDQRGDAHHDANGELAFAASDPETRSTGSTKVIVTNGAFTLNVAATAALEITAARFGDHAAEIEKPHDAFDVPASRRLDVIAAYLPEGTLRVRDAISGADLDGVDVFADFGFALVRNEHAPNPSAYLARGARSPIALHRVTWKNLTGTPPKGFVCVARAPGHALEPVPLEIDGDDPGDHQLFLPPGGDLEVTLTGARPTDGNTLNVEVLRDPEHTVSSDRGGVAFVGRPTRFESLEIGTWFVVAFESGSGWTFPVEVARTRTEVRAGISTRVTLEVRPVALPVAAPLSGTLSVPSGWDASQLSIECNRCDPDGVRGWSTSLRVKPIEGQATLYEWNAGGLAIGRWLITVNTPAPGIVVDLPPAGLNDVRLILPPPAHIAVRLVAADTREPITSAAPCLLPIASEPARTLGDVIPELDGTAWRALVPQGPLRIETRCLGFRPETRQVTIEPEENEFEIPLARECGVKLQLSERGKLVPWPWVLRVTATRDGNEIKVRTGFGALESPAKECMLEQPGRYRFTVPDLNGYLPIAPIEIDVPAGEIVERMIELQPRP